MLIVGDYFDPATNFDNAVTASKLLPNSRLLTSDSWGHTAYGTSSCVTEAVDSFLVKLALPKAGTVCKGPQPFEDSSTAKVAGAGSPAPVVPLVPPVVKQR